MSSSSEGLILPSLYCNDSICVNVALKLINTEYFSEILLIIENNSRISLDIEGFNMLRRVIFEPENMDIDDCKKMMDLDDEFERLLWGASDQHSLGKYNVSIDLGRVKIAENNAVVSELPLEKWREFLLRYNSAIDYKLSFLEKYRLYAGIIHNRIINFYIQMLRESDNIEYFNFDFLKDHIINLDNSVLPKLKNEKIDYSLLDYNVCYMINAEIRLNAAYLIYLDVTTTHISDLLSM